MNIRQYFFAITALSVAVFGILLTALGASHDVMMQKDSCAVVTVDASQCTSKPEHTLHIFGHALGESFSSAPVLATSTCIILIALILHAAGIRRLKEVLYAIGPPRKQLNILTQARELATLSIDLALRAWRVTLEQSGTILVSRTV